MCAREGRLDLRVVLPKQLVGQVRIGNRLEQTSLNQYLENPAQVSGVYLPPCECKSVNLISEYLGLTQQSEGSGKD